jgi:hypothetical protein
MITEKSCREKGKYKGILIMLPTRAMLCRKMNNEPLKRGEKVKEALRGV